MSCVDSGSAPKEARLNVSALYDPNSLMPHVLLLSYDLPELHALVDSSSTHCFVDTKYALGHTLSTYSVSPIVLWLFDGTSNFVITQAVDLSVKFPASSDVTPMTFYLTVGVIKSMQPLAQNGKTHQQKPSLEALKTSTTELLDAKTHARALKLQ